MSVSEWQFDGIVGPTHNYAGLALGNLAAAQNAGASSNPRAAALQGLEKMRVVRDLGMKQAFVPPHFRPNIPELQRCGFAGNLATRLSQAASAAPGLLASIYSSSFMWTANMATVTPSADAADGKLHLTPANLASHYHRGMESEFSKKLLDKIFHNSSFFTVHNYLFQSEKMGDEAAANHMRINYNNNLQSMNVFVYGNDSKNTNDSVRQFPARQQLLASQSIARLHQIDAASTIYLQQSPAAIDQGIFHNDVIAMNTGTVMIAHKNAYIKEHQELIRIRGAEIESFRFREVLDEEFTVADAVSTYLFNSQLLQIPANKIVLVAPAEVANHAAGAILANRFIEEGLIDKIHYLDVRESMRNGGGPACLRLRVTMTEAEASAIHPGIILTDDKFTALTSWVKKFYRDKLCFDDLRDPDFVEELIGAYEALESIIELPGLYAAAIAAARA